MKRHPAILWLVTLLALLPFAVPVEALAQTDDKNLGDKFVKFRSNASHFDTTDEAYPTPKPKKPPASEPTECIEEDE